MAGMPSPPQSGLTGSPARDSDRFLISNLCGLLDDYLTPDEIREVYRAYLFGAEAHEGQTRLSGEPYIYHPLEVARIMAEIRMDAQSIIAAILHDVIEDTPTAKAQLADEFGQDVAELVDGVSKLTNLAFESKAEAKAESFRKMMLAMVNDLRVIIIKLADRLHNMRTLGVMRTDKRRRIARETLEVYAPIAQRLGMNEMRVELEHLGFEALHPYRFRVLEDSVKRVRGNRRELMQKIETSICQRLEAVGIEARIFGREKNLFSIYKKMREKRRQFSEVFDVFAFRMVVSDVDTCYRSLGVVHNLYKPLPGRFKDYVAIPKVNGYQSLHTVLFGPHGLPIEIQIRSDEMDRVAQAGIAAHWLYKMGEGGATAQARAHRWLSDVLEIQQSAGNSLEFLESVKVDLFPDEVYVFTPAGEIRELPRGATAVDYAYSVHSDVGNTCVAVKIDRRLAPLSTVLQSGQTVEVITAPNSRPNPNWLNFVVTARARTNIRHILKNLQREEAVELGRRLLDKALSAYDLRLNTIANHCIDSVREPMGVDDLDALLEHIGLGERMAPLVARRIVEARGGGDNEMQSSAGPLAIQGTEGMVVSYGKCCYPIPGDPIVGVMSTGKGLVIHRESCRNLRSYRESPDQWVQVLWSGKQQREFSVGIRVQTQNQKGVLATIAARVADLGSNIENVSFDKQDGVTAIMAFVLSVQDRKHLARILRALRGIPEVYRSGRVKG